MSVEVAFAAAPNAVVGENGNAESGASRAKSELEETLLLNVLKSVAER